MTSSYSSTPARLPAIPTVRVQDTSLQNFIDSVRETLQVRAGARGDPFEQVVTKRDLIRLGLLDPRTQSSRVSSGVGDGGSGVLVKNPNGSYTSLGYEAFAKIITESRFYKSLMQRLNDPSRFDGLPEELAALLRVDIAAEAALRGADIQRIEHKIQTVEFSGAAAVQEVTASLGSTVAGVRETAWASATQSKATAGVMTQIRAAVGDPSSFTGAGITLEQAMFGIASLDQGLYGQYTVKIDAGGHVAGFGLAVEATGANSISSAFIVAANKFAIVAPGDTFADPLNPDASRVPFGVDTVNNVIYINGNLRINNGGPTLSSLGVGDSAYTGTVYRQIGSAPPAPTGGSFNFATSVLTPPALWTAAQPATTTTPTYACEFTFAGAAGSTATGGTWSTPYIDAVAGSSGTSGTNGESIFVIEVYLQSATAPATPTGGSYTFSTNSFTAPAGGWSISMPESSTTPTYRSAHRFATTTPAVSVAAGAWSAPIVTARDGSTAQTLTLSCTSEGFAFDSTTATSSPGATVYFTAKLQNATGSVSFTATAYSALNASLGPVTLTDVTADSCSITPANFVAGLGTTVRYVVVVATLGGLSDTRTVRRGDNGSSAVQAGLSNQIHSVSTDAAGTVTSYTGSGTTIRVYEGITELDYDGVGTAAGKWTASQSAVGITCGSFVDSGLLLTVGQHSAMTLDQASVTYTISGKTAAGVAFSFATVQGIIKARAGANGSSGTNGTRGSLTGYGYGQYGISSSSWSDGIANRVVDNMLTGASTTSTLGTTGHLRIGDTITLGNGATFTEQKFWSGSGWLQPGTVISGNLLVGGTISGGTNLNISGYAKVEGSSTLTLEDPVSYPFPGSSKTVAIVGNSSGSAQVGVVGIGSASGGYGGFFYNTANNPAMVAMTNSASTVSAAAIIRSVNGTGLQVIGGTQGLVVGGSSYSIIANGQVRLNGPTEVTGQITSTVATGTAAFAISSTTLVGSLNADMVDGQHASAFQPALGFTPVQQGTGTSQTGNAVKIGWSAGSVLRLQIDSTDFGSTWPMNISGSAASITGVVTTGGATASFSGVKPGSATTNAWAQILISGTYYWIPVWT